MTTRPGRQTTHAAIVCFLLSAILLPAPPVFADNCLIDASYNSDAPGRFVFPNWKMMYQGGFNIQLALNAGTPEILAGITIANFGTADGINDIGAVYARFTCVETGPDPDTGLLTLTYAGVYNEDSGPLPVWTWGGASAVDFSGCPDACGTTFPCGAAFTMYLYADLKSCPTSGNTVNLGFPSNEALNPAFPGSLSDTWGCAIPWAIGDINRGADEDTIVLAYKDGPLSAAPGDTITYTIFYGRPGGGSLTNIIVTDTLPTYTHYIIGSGAPAPDPLWDPDPGPPTRLRWTIPGPLATTGGITGMITFQISVDWGNKDSFEPGSGDLGAPEGQPLINSAAVDFLGTTCLQKTAVTTPTRTVVHRFLFWKLGDNDVLYAPALGQPPDEMTYSIFLKNLSSTKTWWDVKVWDTVPAQLDSWGAGFGFDDPCQGWTMTPSGCAAASPGVVVTGAKTTIMTWKLDMPPGMTITLNWRAQVRGSVTVGATAVNQIMIRGAGKTSIVDGTGDTGAPRIFTHAAQIILRTTYVSYVGYAGSTDSRSCPGYFISFFPLNKQTQFELRGIQYQGAAQWSGLGGVSDSIGCYLGDCLSGFPGAAGCTLGTGAIPGGGLAGCKVERVPATYDPLAWQGTCATYPFNFIFKITSNAPVVWQLLTHMGSCNQDRHTYAPASNLTYAGFMMYTWRGDYADGSTLGLINTGMSVSGGFNASTQTTAHLFKFNYGSLQWDYQKSFDIAGESQVSDWSICPNNSQPCPDTAPWRVMSSDTEIIMNVGEYSYNTAGCCCCSGADNHAAFAPMRETGYAVGAGNFYGICEPSGCGSNDGLVIVGSVNAAATYNVWTYTPDTNVGSAKVAPLLRGTSGSWTLKVTGATLPLVNTVPPPAGYPFDIWTSVPFKRGGSNLFKIECTSGGPIQVLHGTDMFGQWSGGAPIHAFDGKPSGSTFWHHQTHGRNTCETLVVQLFTPKTGVVIRAVSNDGYSARYTTTGTDQSVGFVHLSCLATAARRTTRFDVLTVGQAAMCQYQQTQVTEKGFTAPFLASGEHYTIIAPPVVFTGQSFWLTVIAESGLGGIDTTYTGTASFTSTDPTGKIENAGMDSYNYTFTLADAGDRMFINVTFTKLGLQTFVAADILDGSITGLAAIMVVGADVKLSKVPRLSVQASGDTVRFQICWSNYSSTSAFTFVITDAVPMGTTFVPEAGTQNFDCGSTDGVTTITAYSISTSATPPAAASFVTGNPPGVTTRWLRWTLPMAGVGTTGCVCFRVSVN